MVYFCPRMSTSTRCLSAIAPHHSPLTLPSPQRGEGVSIPYPALSPEGRGSFNSLPCPLANGERLFQFPGLTLEKGSRLLSPLGGEDQGEGGLELELVQLFENAIHLRQHVLALLAKRLQLVLLPLGARELALELRDAGLERLAL